VTLILWGKTALHLVDEEDPVDNSIRRKILNFSIPLESKYQHIFSHNLFDSSSHQIAFKATEVSALIKFMLNRLPRNQSIFKCKILMHNFARLDIINELFNPLG
jgi:hypothetical protein